MASTGVQGSLNGSMPYPTVELMPRTRAYRQEIIP